MTKLLVGLTSYKDLHYLKEVLPALEQLRTELSATIVVLDNAWEKDIQAYVKEHFPKFHVIQHKEHNVGYGRSYSEILRRFPKHDLFLVTTNDVLLDVPTVKTFVERMKEDESIAVCAGKIYMWDFDKKRKTQIIDSFGLAAQKYHHFADRGHGEKDHGQYDDRLNDVFGVSGAAFLIRTSVVPKLHGNEWQLFDDRMWMYKEDADLSYRLRWLGETIRVFPEVWAWHARTTMSARGTGLVPLVRADNLKHPYSRNHSYRNHFVLLKNNWSWRYGLWVSLRMLWYEFLKGGYMLLRHPFAFFGGMKALLFWKGRSSERKASPQEVLSYFE